MKVIFVAGAYRATTEWGVEENIQRAERVAIELWKSGWMAFCPHKNTAHFGGILPDEIWLKGDRVVLHWCDAICMVEGWEKSEGATDEYMDALALGLPIYLSHFGPDGVEIRLQQKET